MAKRMPIGLQAQKIRIDMVNAGVDPEMFDTRAHIDSSLSFRENRYNVANIAGYKVGKKKTTSTRSGFSSRNLQDLYGQADDFYRAERNRKAAERRRARGPVPAKKVSAKKFKKMKQLPLFQSDDWPYFPTKHIDKSRSAKPPGRRRSKSGHIYYERRRNRSDMPGTNL